VANTLADGRRFRARPVIDLFTRECLAIDAGQSLRGGMSRHKVPMRRMQSITRAK